MNSPGHLDCCLTLVIVTGPALLSSPRQALACLAVTLVSQLALPHKGVTLTVP